jgi:xanthosine utilization system XapX-like protein
MPQLENRWTIGNLATLVGIVGIIIGLGRIYGAMDTTMSGQARTLTEHEMRILGLERGTTDRLARIETLLHRIEKELGK